MRDFEYCAPDSLHEALSLLERGATARVLAGGTDLVVQMKYGRAEADVLVDIKRIPELNHLEWDQEKGIFIGAAVPVRKALAFPPLSLKYGPLRDALSLIGSYQLRSRATMGGNVCNAAPSADSAPPLLCLEAVAVVAGPEGTRRIPLRDFFAGPGKTILTASELLLGVEIPTPPIRSAGSYLRHTPRQDMDIAVAGVAAFAVFDPDGRCREARVALGAVAPTPIRVPHAEALLADRVLTDDLIGDAANAASEAARPISDMRGSAAYRTEIVRVLVKRSLERVRNLRDAAAMVNQ